MELKNAVVGKSLLLESRLGWDGNRRSSPELGATSVDQFAAVVQLLSPPPPSHVLVTPVAVMSVRTTSLPSPPAYVMRNMRPKLTNVEPSGRPLKVPEMASAPSLLMIVSVLV